MKPLKIFSLGLLAALWMACDTGGIHVQIQCTETTDCPENYKCVDRVCKLGEPGGPNPVNPGEPGGPQKCTSTTECNRGICNESGECVDQCNANNPCDNGACNENTARCVVECNTNAGCSDKNQACDKGVCKPFVCATECDRTQVCSDDPDSAKPTDGKCVARICSPSCKTAPDQQETCVVNPNTPNSRQGICRPSCVIPKMGLKSLCNPGQGCKAIDDTASGQGEPGTCEEGCLSDLDCKNDNWETCEDATLTTVTVGTNEMLTASSLGICKAIDLEDGECRNIDDCGYWETCEDADQATLTPGTCTLIDPPAPGSGQCKTFADCGEWEICEGAIPAKATLGTCEEVVPVDDQCKDNGDCEAGFECAYANKEQRILGTCEPE